MGHIELARWADLVLVAPATAHFLARLRLGLADDLLSTLCLATEAPIAVAPGDEPADVAESGHPGKTSPSSAGVACASSVRREGDQACGETGPGRMEEPEIIASRFSEQLPRRRET